MEKPVEPEVNDTQSYTANCTIYLGKCILYLADKIAKTFERREK